MLRLLLDAHVSGRVVGTALREAGHDVRALSEEAALEGMDDSLVLDLAAREGRILVTHNVRDFAPLLRVRAEAGLSHAGCILVEGLGHSEFGVVIPGLEALLQQRPAQDDWTDLALFLSRPRKPR